MQQNETNPRKAAVQLLARAEDAYTNLLLEGALDKIPPVSRAYVTRAVYGVTERRLTLDYLLSQHLRGRPDKLDRYVLAALRLGLYEAFYMDGVPAHAAVNEAVSLVKNSKYRRAAPLTNAVLRAALRSGPEALLQGNDPEALSIRYSCPQWLVNSLTADYGAEDTLSILQHSMVRPPVTIRVNTDKIDADGLLKQLKDEGCTAAPHALFPQELLTLLGGVPTATTAFAEGLYFVQDAASLLCSKVVAEGNPAHVLDLCAAPGGKSFSVSLFSPAALVTAMDLHPYRVGLVEESAARLSLAGRITTAVGDATIYNPAIGQFDAVLCDVPCSGFGTMSKKPDVRYKPQSEADALPPIQQAILAVGAQHVKAGGRLIYATCTLRCAENDEIVSAFLAGHPDFSACVPDWPMPVGSGGSHSMTLLPHTYDTDGFFIAGFVRNV